MTFEEIAKEIAKREGKKKSVNITQIREILSIVADLTYENGDVTDTLWNLGMERLRKRETIS